MNIRTAYSTDLPALRSLWQEAFHDTEDFLDHFFQTAFACSRCRCVTVNDEIAAALYWFDCLYQERPVAYLYAIATAKNYQGQGICHKLMQDTHTHLKTAGYEAALLVPGSPSLFSFYAALGYQTCCHIKEHQVFSAPPALPLKQVSPIEYAALRRTYLPKDGILQEHICLDFLQTQATLYAGNDFIMAAHKEKDTLFAAEFLGDIHLAPQALCALHCSQGTFRTPGTERPFAMYLPLQPKPLTPPAYFGLAFD